jgi:hypothetical protein
VAKSRAKAKASVNVNKNIAAESILADLEDALKNQNKKSGSGSESDSSFKSALKRFVGMAKAGDPGIANATIEILLREPMEGSSAKAYDGGGYVPVPLDYVEFVDADGITFYPKGNKGNPMVFVTWNAISSVVLR